MQIIENRFQIFIKLTLLEIKGKPYFTQESVLIKKLRFFIEICNLFIDSSRIQFKIMYETAHREHSFNSFAYIRTFCRNSP